MARPEVPSEALSLFRGAGFPESFRGAYDRYL
jgi:hypothetical protein